MYAKKSRQQVIEKEIRQAYIEIRRDHKPIIKLFFNRCFSIFYRMNVSPCGFFLGKCRCPPVAHTGRIIKMKPDNQSLR